MVRDRDLGAYLIRTFNQTALGPVCRTTRVGALFSLYIVLESAFGRLVPLTLMPDWVQTLAWFPPFRWTSYFPIESLVGDPVECRAPYRARDAAFLTLVGIGLFSLVWRFAIRRYTAVGN